MKAKEKEMRELLGERFMNQGKILGEQWKDDVEALELLWKFTTGDDHRLAMLSSWIWDHALDLNPGMRSIFMDRAVKFLPKAENDSIRRPLIRTISRSDIPKKYYGKLVDLLFNWLESNEIGIAVKVHSMTALGQIAEVEKGIAGELAIVIKDRMPFESAGFKSRGKKILKKISES